MRAAYAEGCPAIVVLPAFIPCIIFYGYTAAAGVGCGVTLQAAVLRITASPDGKPSEPVGKLRVNFCLSHTTRQIDILWANYLKWRRLLHRESSAAGGGLPAIVPGGVLDGHAASAGEGSGIVL